MKGHFFISPSVPQILFLPAMRSVLSMIVYNMNTGSFKSVDTILNDIFLQIIIGNRKMKTVPESLIHTVFLDNGFGFYCFVQLRCFVKVSSDLKTHLSGVPKKLPCPVKMFHLSKKEPHIWIEHNKTNNF